MKFSIKQILFFSIPLFAILHCQVSTAFKENAKAEKGIMNLTFLNFERRGPIVLSGDWLFFKNAFLNQNEINENKEGILLEVPGIWNNQVDFQSKIIGYGYGTYYLKLQLPPDKKKWKLGLRMKEQATAYELFINGELATSRGKIAKSTEKALPQYGTRTIFFETAESKLDIILHVSNFHHRNGGMWSAPILGLQDQILILQYERNFIEFILGGSILIITIYHFMLFFFRRNDKPSLYFAIFCMVTLMRVISTGEIMLAQMIPNIPLEVVTKFEYISFFLLGSTFFKYHSELFLEDIPKKAVNFFLIIGLSLSLLTLFSNFKVYNHFTNLNYICLIVLIFTSYYFHMKIILQRRQDSLMMFFFTHLLLFFVLNDILNTLRIIQTSDLLPIGVFIYLLAQSILISRRLSKAFRDIEVLSDNMNELNQVYSRFVPKQFLKLLDKESILEVGIGDFAEKEITVLFSGIRGFIPLTEKLGSKEIIVFLNKYYLGIIQIIKKNNGFIDKFVGDDITVIFPNSPEDAVKSAKEICLYVNEFNKQKIENHFPEIRIGIGIHTGKVHFGTIGAEDRMDTTLIGDTVMIARMMEGITKFFHVPILLTFQTYSMLDTSFKKYIREIDTSKVRGREGLLTVYEYFEVDEEEFRKQKILLKDRFFTGLTQFRGGLTKKAREIFQECNRTEPNDPIFFIYINRCNDIILSKKDPSDEFSSPDQIRVLIADDNPAHQEYLEIVLKKENIDVVFAKTEVDFLNLTRRISPNFIILSNFFDKHFCNYYLDIIRENILLDPERCFIAISGEEKSMNRESIYLSGANDVLYIPFSIDEIKKTLMRIK